MDQKRTPETHHARDRSNARSAMDVRANSPLVIVYDSLQECPYIEGEVARMPLEYPRRPLSADDLDQLLELGYRRTGGMLYRTHCPNCEECIPVRVDVTKFVVTRSMRRILNRCDRELEVRWGRPIADGERLKLFNDHRQVRDLSNRGPVDQPDYHEFLVASCVETAELTFRRNQQLIGIGIVDVGTQSLNAVYTHFEPEMGRYSIGTLAVLLQIQHAQETGRQYVYLGLYVASNSHLNYKDRFQPQQRRIGNRWVES